MDQVPAAIRNLRKAPQPGDVFRLGQKEYITVISVRPGEVRYALGAFKLDMNCDAPQELMRTSIAMPYKTFRKWLATIAVGRRVDTPPPA